MKEFYDVAADFDALYLGECVCYLETAEYSGYVFAHYTLVHMMPITLWTILNTRKEKTKRWSFFLFTKLERTLYEYTALESDYDMQILYKIFSFISCLSREM